MVCVICESHSYEWDWMLPISYCATLQWPWGTMAITHQYHQLILWITMCESYGRGAGNQLRIPWKPCTSSVRVSSL